MGKAIASSSEFVCKLCVCPMVAARASMQVRATLLKGSCSVRLQPEVCECVLSAMDFGFLGLKPLMIFAQSTLALRSLAISMK